MLTGRHILSGYLLAFSLFRHGLSLRLSTKNANTVRFVFVVVIVVVNGRGCGHRIEGIYP